MLWKISIAGHSKLCEIQLLFQFVISVEQHNIKSFLLLSSGVIFVSNLMPQEDILFSVIRE